MRRRINRKRLFFRKALFVLGIAGVATWALSSFNARHNPQPNPETAAASRETTLALAQKPATDVQTAIEDIVAANPDIDLSVSFLDLTNGTQASVNPTTSFFGGSTTKLLTAILFLQDVQNGSHSLSEVLGPYPASYHLEQLITYSNNDSWAFFNDALTLPAQQDWAIKMGLTSYKWDQNTFSAQDLTTLLSKLYRGELLNPENTKLLLSYMNGSTDEQYLAQGFPPGSTVYHKAGIIDDAVHDGAIIEDGSHEYILSVFSGGRGYQDYDARAALFQSMAQAVAAAVRQ